MKIMCYTKSYSYNNYRIYDNGYSWDVYNGPDKVASEFLTSEEAENYVDGIVDNHMYSSEDLNLYRVYFVTSSDTSSYIEIYAKNEKSAKIQAKKQLGRECFRIVSVMQIN